MSFAGQPQANETSASISPYVGSEEGLAALAKVRNETLRATTLLEDYRDFSPRDMYDYYDQGGFSLENNAWLMFFGGEPAGAAILYPSYAFHDRPAGNFHLYVVPSVRGQGLGSRLLDFLETEAYSRGYPILETTIAAEDDHSTRFLAANGFKVVGHSHHLVRDHTGSHRPIAFPTAYRVMSLLDMGETADFYLETANRLGAYDPNYSLITEDDISREVEEGRFQPSGVFLLFDPQQRIVGLIRAALAPGGSRGYLPEIRLEPASRGKGLGLALVDTALQHLEGLGAHRVELDTAGENLAAYNLATRAGFSEARHWLHFLKSLSSRVAPNK